MKKSLVQNDFANPTQDLYRALQCAFDYFNTALFDEKLPRCLMTLNRSGRQLAFVQFDAWENESKENIDEISINPEYLLDLPVSIFCQTLVHEMVHIWQFHFGRPRRNYHNAQWARKMVSIGLQPTHDGTPWGCPEGVVVSDYIVLNGPFYIACRKFLNDGFTIPWALRHSTSRTRNESKIRLYDEKLKAVEEVDPLFLRTFHSNCATEKDRNGF